MSESVSFEIPLLDLTVMAIEEASKSASPGEEIKLHLTYENGLSEFNPEDVRTALLELHDQKVITMPFPIEFPQTERDFRNHIVTYFHIIISDKFEKWKSKYWNKRRGQDSSSEIIHRITFNKAREIQIDDEILISRPDFDSENERIFTYVYENPNRRISKTEIEDHYREPITKSLNKVVENLGFTGDLRKVFFDVSKNSIRFKNPVTKQELEQFGITSLEITRKSPQ